MPFTYMLECADGSLYVGSTVNLEARVSQHDLGQGAAYTRPRRRRPVRLAWCAQFDRVEDAFRYEKQIQGWSRAKRLALIEGRAELLARGFEVGAHSMDHAILAREKPLEHPGEELIYVLEGELEFSVGGKPFLLRPCDALHFRTVQPHSWRNPGTVPAVAVWLALRPQ